MKLHLDAADLNDRLRSLFAEEGLNVQDMAWGFDDVNGPSLELELGGMPDGSNIPLRTTVAALEARVAIIEGRVTGLEITGLRLDANQPDQPQDKQHWGKRNKRPGHTQPAPKKPDPSLSPRMQAAVEEIERDANLLGPKLIPGQRQLSGNESYEYPG